MRITTTAVTLSTLLAATLLAEPNAQGDFLSNETPVQAQTTEGTNAAGSLWRVEVDKLLCRKSPDGNSTPMRAYDKGSILEVEVYRGGSDEVLVNALDKNKKPWMPVRGKKGETVCYVRANNRYIRPVTEPVKSEPSSAAKCFQNDGQKYRVRVKITFVSPAQIKGTVLSDEYDDNAVEQADFTGAKAAGGYAVKFAGKPPVVGENSSWTQKPWAITSAGGKETLRIRFNAKDYTTNRWSETVYEFNACE